MTSFKLLLLAGAAMIVVGLYRLIISVRQVEHFFRRKSPK